jgi:hypothetical protein
MDLYVSWTLSQSVHDRFYISTDAARQTVLFKRARPFTRKIQRFNVFCEFRVQSHSLYHAIIANRRALC